MAAGSVERYVHGERCERGVTIDEKVEIGGLLGFGGADFGE